MNELERISIAFEAAEEIPFDDSSRIVFMSDCHRGDSGWADDFARNQEHYFAALSHYYKENFTYIELGDGDELWENRYFDDIVHAHNNVFWLLSKFHDEGRLHMIYGNHDIVKRDEKFVRSNMYEYYSERENRETPLFKNIKLHEALILNHCNTGNKIYLIHGHQVDYLNDKLWRLARFLVRYLWRPLESFGANDPTSAAKNYYKTEAIGKKLTEWVAKENKMLIAGHNHKPMFPEIGQPLYFNDGSCVHPHGITALEICEGDIVLVKWETDTRDDGTLFIDRIVMTGPRRLQDYFDANSFTDPDSSKGDC